MESLNNYITERIRIDNIKHPEFPIKGDYDATIVFLKEQGFERLPHEFYGSEQHQFVNIFNDQHIRGWMYYLAGDLTMITFADTTDREISKDNPMIQIYFENDKPTNRIAVSGCHTCKYCTEREFLDILNKRFEF
jgi:hypothetical protein